MKNGSSIRLGLLPVLAKARATVGPAVSTVKVRVTLVLLMTLRGLFQSDSNARTSMVWLPAVRLVSANFQRPFVDSMALAYGPPSTRT
ncbi:MAG: hypothetical protein WCS70_11885 [Verrucomicrobiota bacterium]